MPDNADLLSNILENISEIINNTLHEEDREGPEVREKLLKQIDNVLELRKHEAPPEKILNATKRLNAFHMLYWKCMMEYKAANLNKEKKCDQDSLLNVILSAIMLGVYRGNRFVLDKDEYFQFMDPMTHKEVSSAIARSAHRKNAEIFQKNIKEALRQAEKEWTSGSRLFHDQMADSLLKEFPRIKGGLPETWNFKKQLRVHLKPIARKFNRVRGEKKMTKT